MAVMPDGSTVPQSYFQTLGSQHGEAAARMKRPRSAVDEDMRTRVTEFQDPRYNATATDKSTYRTAWLNRYDYVLKQLTPQEQKMAQEATAQEEKKLTVEQWEKELNIPSWSIAEAVTANFHTEEQAFEGAVSGVSNQLSKSTEGTKYLAKAASFFSQWRAVRVAILAHTGYTPSTAVAEVRKARLAMSSLKTELAALLPKVQQDVVAPPPPPPQTDKPPVVPPIAAKAKFPGWAIFAAIAAAAGGLFFAFRKKKETPKLPPSSTVSTVRR